MVTDFGGPSPWEYARLSSTVTVEYWWAYETPEELLAAAESLGCLDTPKVCERWEGTTWVASGTPREVAEGWKDDIAHGRTWSREEEYQEPYSPEGDGMAPSQRFLNLY